MNRKGFTLIELLVVISIISLLSSVLLSSLSSARGKANDAKVKTQLASLRSGAELYRDNNNNTYGVSTTLCTTGMFGDTTSGISQILAAISTTKDCGATASAYAVAATLPSGAGTGAWCVDSTGVSRDRTTAGVLYSGLTGLTGAKTAAGATSCR